MLDGNGMGEKKKTQKPGIKYKEIQGQKKFERKIVFERIEEKLKEITSVDGISNGMGSGSDDSKMRWQKMHVILKVKKSQSIVFAPQHQQVSFAGKRMILQFQ